MARRTWRIGARPWLVGGGSWLVVCGAFAVSIGCGADAALPTAPSSTADEAAAPSPPTPQGPVGGPTATLVGAGDIASCSSEGDEATARLLDGIDGTVVTLGDNAYGDGTADEFRSCYDPSWGRHKSRTRPSPGNHDYESAGAGPYFAYFGDRAGPSGVGYYSYEVGSWHVVSLNSNVPAGAGSAQAQWLRSDLASHPTACTLAYWHHPVFSSGSHGNDSKMAEIWRILYEQQADVVLNGHDHEYERFAPQTPDGAGDPARGIREFVVGTGGKSLRSFKRVEPNSEVRLDSDYGVLRLELSGAGYAWSFVAASGAVLDTGAASCVG